MDKANTASQKELKTQQNKFWLQTQVNDILEPMMLATCQANPNDKVNKLKFPLTYKLQIGYMLKYLEDKYGSRASQGDKANLMNMRAEVGRLEALLDQQKVKTAGTSQNDAQSDRGSEL